MTAVQVQPSDIRGGYIHQTISWRRPDNHTHITHYLIQYGAGITRRDTEGGGLNTVNSTTNSTVLMLPKPTNLTTYSVWVAAVSEAGQGEFSDRVDFSYSSKPSLKWLQITSIPFIPTTYTSLAGPGTPTDVSVQAQSCHTLKVMWSSPDHTGGLPITGYNISYTDGITNYVQGTFAEQMALIQHCSPGTTYKVKVVAFNVIGQGEETTMTTVRTNHRGIQLQIRQLHCARVQYIKQLDYAPFKISITYYICRVVSTYVPVLQ